MPVPYTFGSATSAIPLSQLDSNFNTTITLGNTAIQLGNTVTTLNNMTFANVTISSVSTPITVAQGGTGTSTAFTAGSVVFAGASGVYSQNNAQLFWDNTNARLGVGTSSPSTKLHVSAGRTTLTANNEQYALQLNYGSALNGPYLGSTGTDTFVVSTSGGATQMTLTSSGNLGLGVTPSAWGSGIKALQVGVGLSPSLSYVNGFDASHNAYYDGTNWRYIISSYNAGRYTIFGSASGNSSHAWFTAPSGTAGNAISFTQAMTLDASGNLLVGLTSIGTQIRLALQGADTTSGNYTAFFQNPSATLFFVRNDGVINLGVGSLSPYNLTTGNAANLYLDSNGTLYRSTSSLKYKTDVQDATHGLADVLKLRPVTYKGKNDGDKVFGGLIAEEVHEAGLTEFVQYATDGSPDALHYGNMVALCVKAIQELNAKVQALESQLAAKG